MSDYSELKRLAEECPWEAIESFEYPAAGGKAYCLGSGKTEHLLTTFDRRFQQYIEAARPAVMLALLDKLERAELTALKAGQGETWKCSSCGATSGAICNENGCFENERSAPPASADAVSVPRELLERWKIDCGPGHPLFDELRALLAQSESKEVK